MSLLDHVSNVAFASSIPTDLILGTLTGSLASPASSVTLFPAKTTTLATIPTGINEKTFFQGVFSTDNGVTWVDFNSNISKFLGSFANLQTQMMYGYSKAGTITVAADNWNQTANGTSYTASAYTFLYKIVLFARPGQGDITPQNVGQQQNFSSFYNYQKIFRDSVFPFSFAPGTTTATITHSLGYIPRFRSYIDNFTYSGGPDAAGLFDFGYFPSQFTLFSCYMDTNTISYFINNADASNVTGTLYTRIYYA